MADRTAAPDRPSPGSGRTPRGFAATEVWIFDLDNTLYPAACDLFAEIDRRMAEFIARLLGVPLPEARHLQKTYYRRFGTTLSGLMRVHRIAPEQFLDFVHDIGLDALKEDPALARALAALPGRKLIFTNGSRRHAERVAGKLGVLDLFEDICDIAACGYVPKPTAEAFDRMIRRHNVAPKTAAMFEDMPANLEAPHALGMTTVLVSPCPPPRSARPLRHEIARWRELPPHIHYLTGDLGEFLENLLQSLRPAASGACAGEVPG